MEINEIYQLSMKVSQQIWDIVMIWPYFARETIGKQMVRSADSVSANLKEGLGRYSYKDRNLFNIYARGSLFETQCWLEKASARNLIEGETMATLSRDFNLLHLEINKMIKHTRAQLQKS
jgi:four helix bundle protein